MQFKTREPTRFVGSFFAVELATSTQLSLQRVIVSDYVAFVHLKLRLNTSNRSPSRALVENVVGSWSLSLFTHSLNWSLSSDRIPRLLRPGDVSIERSEDNFVGRFGQVQLEGRLAF